MLAAAEDCPDCLPEDLQVKDALLITVRSYTPAAIATQLRQGQRINRNVRSLDGSGIARYPDVVEHSLP
jgi:hypothetical protein